MYIIRVYVQRFESTHEHLHDLSQELFCCCCFCFFLLVVLLCTHCRMTNRNLWIERVCSKVDPSREASREIQKDVGQKRLNCKIKLQFDDLMILCCFLCDEAYRDINSWRGEGEGRRSVFQITEQRRLWSETERNCTGKHEVQFRPFYTCILVRHPGPEKPKHNHVSILFFFSFFF